VKRNVFKALLGVLAVWFIVGLLAIIFAAFGGPAVELCAVAGFFSFGLFVAFGGFDD